MRKPQIIDITSSAIYSDAKRTKKTVNVAQFI